MREVRRPWTLRSRLVAVVVALVAAALVATGVAVVSLLRAYLVGQVDAQLTQVARTASLGIGAGEPPQQRSMDPRRGGPAPGPSGMQGPLPADVYIETVDRTGAVTSTVADSFIDAEPSVPQLDPAGVRRYAGRPFTVDSVDEGPQWRVLVVPTTSGAVAIAISMTEVNGTVARLTVLLVALGTVVIAASAGAAYVLVRRNLAPLAAVEEAAVAIADGDLERRVPDRPRGTEVGEMSAALNTMLARLALALTQREEALHESQASEERMRAFVADASHELRTPLTAVRGYAELYSQGAIPPDEVPETMDRIEGEANRMADLVDDLLLLARLDQRRPLAREPVDVLSLVSDRAAAVAAAHTDAVIDVRADAGDDPPMVMGDEARLGQVITNLVTNAVRHGGGHAWLVVRRASDGAVEIDCADRGQGVPDEAKSRVFERFYRADVARSRASGGAGLGLSIVAAIVVAHHGSVVLLDTPGGGATFRVRLPAATPGAVAT